MQANLLNQIHSNLNRNIWSKVSEVVYLLSSPVRAASKELFPQPTFPTTTTREPWTRQTARFDIKNKFQTENKKRSLRHTTEFKCCYTTGVLSLSCLFTTCRVTTAAPLSFFKSIFRNKIQYLLFRITAFY